MTVLEKVFRSALGSNSNSAEKTESESSELLLALLAEARAEIGCADQKAAIILAAIGVAAGKRRRGLEHSKQKAISKRRCLTEPASTRRTPRPTLGHAATIDCDVRDCTTCNHYTFLIGSVIVGWLLSA
jgi:hypothetical protein